MRSAASRAATTMTTHPTAERTLLRVADSGCCAGGSAGGGSGGGAVRGGDWSIGGVRVPLGSAEPSASAGAVSLEKPTGGVAPCVGESVVRGLDHPAFRAEAKKEALQPRALAHSQSDAQAATA